MKKILIFVSIIITILMFTGCDIQQNGESIIIDGKEYTKEELSKMEQANEKLEAYLNVKVSEIKLEDGYFVGTIQNTNKDKDINNITLDIGLYDSQGNKVDDKVITIGKIYHGETYKINEKYNNNKNAATFKLVDKQINFK
jgi:hypothetical protein